MPKRYLLLLLTILFFSVKGQAQSPSQPSTPTVQTDFAVPPYRPVVLHFAGMKLTDVFARLCKYYHKRVVYKMDVSDRVLAHGGVRKGDKLENILQVIYDIYKIPVTLKDDVITVG